MQKLLFIFAVCSALNASAQFLVDDVMIEMYSSPVGYVRLEVDQEGNVYGSHQAFGMFEGGQVYGAGGQKVVYKLDKTGDLIWAYETTGNCMDIKTNGSGQIYQLSYNGFGAPIDTISIPHNFMNYIANIDTNGVFKNIVRFPSVPQFSIRENGNVVFVFEYDGAGYLGNEYLTGINNNSIIYGEFDTNGNVLWREIMNYQFWPSNALDLVEGCAVTGDELFFYGTFHNTGEFDTISLVLDNYNGVTIEKIQVYLARADLSTQTVTQVVSTDNLYFTDIEIDNQNRIYLASQHYKEYNAGDAVFQGVTIPVPYRRDGYVFRLNPDLSMDEWYDVGVSATIDNSNLWIKGIELRNEDCFLMGYMDGDGIGTEMYLYPGGPNICDTNNYFLVRIDDSLNYVSDYVIPTVWNTQWAIGQEWDFDLNGDYLSTFLHTSSPLDTVAFNDNYFIGYYKINANVIKGRAYKDFNQNSIYDAGDIPLMGSVVSTDPPAYLSVVKPDGQYELYVDTGEYVIEIPTAPTYYTKAPVNDTIYFSGVDMVDTSDLTLVPVPGGNDVRVDLIPLSIVTPDDIAKYKILITNDGTYIEDGTVLLYPLDYSIAYAGPVTVPVMTNQGSYFSYDFTGLLPGDTFSIDVEYSIPITYLSIIGEVSTTYAQVNIVNTDIALSNNTSVLQETVLASYDPNMKLVNRPKLISVDSLSNFEYLNYTIHFQNEGNYPATDVRIDDQIANELNLVSFQIIDYSDDVYATINGRTVSFYFDSIMLPDSTSDPEGSKGFVHYRIKKYPGLVVGDSILNSARIYFDVNPPIFTDTTMNIIVATCALNDSVMQTDPLTLESIVSGATYQWLDCSNNYAPIVGETNQSFTATTNGIYAVMVSNSNCIDTSACFVIDEVDLQELFNPNRELIRIVDFMGRETQFVYNTPLIFIYSDGTRERIMVIEK